MSKTAWGTLILVLCALLGCRPAETGSGGAGGNTTSATAGMGGGGTTATSGGGTTASTTSGSTSSDPGIVVGPPEECGGNTSIAPGTGQAGFHEEGAFACRRFVPPAGHSHLREWSPAVGLSPACVAFPIATSFLAPIDQTWPVADVTTLDHYTETPVTDEDTEPMIAVGLDIPEGQAFYACLRLIVDEFGGPSCTAASTCPESVDEPLADMLFSLTKPDKTIDPFPVIDLVELRVSPDETWAVTLGNNNRAWNTTATFE